MKISIGKKIQELRREHHKKQEELANALGVTSQAVSRWETDGSYPDLELLPPIAHYFGVTIDELFGYQSERETKVEAYFARIQAMNRENNGVDKSMDACVRLARECLAEFPEEKRLVYALASVLYNAGYVRHGEHHLTDENGYDIFDTQRHSAYDEWQEAIGLYEKALEQLEHGPLRDRALRELLQLYVNTGEAKKADRLIGTCSDMDTCREILRIHGCDGQERAKRYGEAILTTASRLAQLMVSAVIANKARLSPQDTVSVLRHALSIYRAVCPDEQYGVYHLPLAHIHLFLSEHLWLSGEREEAFSALDAALQHAKRYDELRLQKSAGYTAPLLNLITIRQEEWAPVPMAPTLPEDWPWWHVPDGSGVKAEMEADSRWSDWVNRCGA